MNETIESTPVTEFILSSEKNLRIAEAVHSGWEAAKNMVARDFCRRLGAELEKKLPEWKWEDSEFLRSRRGVFVLSKPAWENQYCILLQPEDYGAEMTYGIMRDERSIAKRPFSTELLEAIKKRVPSARAKAWWEALIKIQSPGPDWRTPEILWQMHTKDEFLQEVASLLLEIAQLSEKLVDSLVAQYQGKKKK
jgi:hypothetical protein